MFLPCYACGYMHAPYYCLPMMATGRLLWLVLLAIVERLMLPEVAHCSRYTVLGRTFVVVSDPKVLPAVLDSSNFVKSPLGGDGGLSEEAHTGLAPAFGAEGAK